MSQTTSLRMTLPLSEMIYWSVAGAMAVAFAVTLLIAAFDQRTIDGAISVWAKPLKFEFSLAIHAGTLALVMAGLSQGTRTGSAMTIVAIAFLAACVIEMSYIIGQAARAEHSHFNMSTPFYRFMWSMMAIAAVVIIGAAAAVGIATAFDSDSSFPPALRWAIILGLLGGTLLTLYTAFTIGARMSPYIGSAPTHEMRMVLTGWSLAGGDLRVSHFLATHMIQILPLAGLAIALVAPGRAGIAVVFVIAALWTAATLAEYTRALGGKPSPMALLLS
ncbi:MAG: hypothetical protein AAF709_18250 [Pseudomonadota bacterium]